MSVQGEQFAGSGSNAGQIDRAEPAGSQRPRRAEHEEEKQQDNTGAAGTEECNLTTEVTDEYFGLSVVGNQVLAAREQVQIEGSRNILGESGRGQMQAGGARYNSDVQNSSLMDIELFSGNFIDIQLLDVPDS